MVATSVLEDSQVTPVSYALVGEILAFTVCSDFSPVVFNVILLVILFPSLSTISTLETPTVTSTVNVLVIDEVVVSFNTRVIVAVILLEVVGRDDEVMYIVAFLFETVELSTET